MVTQMDPYTVEKRGMNVKQNEEQALHLVVQCAPDIPVLKMYFSSFTTAADGLPTGVIYMDFVEGRVLTSVWPSFSKQVKEQVCCDIWALISKLR